MDLNNSPDALVTANGIIDAIPLSLTEQPRYEAGVPIALLNKGAATFIPAANDPDNERKSDFFSGAMYLPTADRDIRLHAQLSGFGHQSQQHQWAAGG
jgi:hypothetical protein